LHLFRGVLNGLDNVVISSAAAKVTFQGVSNLGLGRIRIALEKLHGGEDHAWGAKATLKAMFFPESFLNWMELSVGCQALDRHDACPISLYREDGARLDRFTVDEDGACAALGRVAANVGAGQPQDIAQVMNEKETRFYVVLIGFAVDGDAHVTHCGLPP